MGPAALQRPSSNNVLTVEALVMRAERRPLPGVHAPGPHQLYARPTLLREKRVLSALPHGHVRVRVHLVGICGTDLKAVSAHPETGYILGSAPLDVPEAGRVLGHEGVGEVMERGDGVTSVSVGAWVGFESLLPCKHCVICTSGHPNECQAAVLLGLQRDGLFTQIADIPAPLVRELGALAKTERGLQAAACVEPAACSLRALQLGRMRAGERVLVFGAGPIGMAAALLARYALGAAHVRVVEPLRLRRNLAAEWAHSARDVDSHFNDPSDPYDVLIEASGNLDNVRRALPHMGPNGRVMLMARSGAPLTLDHVDHMISSNVSLIGCRGHAGGVVNEVLDLLKAGTLPLHALVTGVLEGLGPLESALREPHRVIEEHCKLLVRP